MTNTDLTEPQQPNKFIGKSIKVAVGIFFQDMSYHVAPKFVGFLYGLYPDTAPPFFDEAMWFEVVVLFFTFGNAFIAWVTWKNLAGAVTEAIRGINTWIKELRTANNQP